MRHRYAVAAILFLVCGAALAGPERPFRAPAGPRRPPERKATGPRISPLPTWTGSR